MTADYLTLTARAMSKVQDDMIHALLHSFDEESISCPTCQAVRARQKQWEQENPRCDCDCCEHER